MHREIMLEIPCYRVLQALSNSSAACAHFSAMCVWPRLFLFDKAQTPFKDWSLKTAPRFSRNYVAEIRIDNMLQAEIVLRRLYDFVLKLSTPNNSPKKSIKPIENEIYLGCFWLESSCYPFPENTYSPWKIRMIPTDLILEDKFPKQFEPYKAAIKYYLNLIEEEFKNSREGEFEIENGATLFSQHMEGINQELVQ